MKKYEIILTEKTTKKQFNYESDNLPKLKNLGFGIVINFDNVYFTLNSYDLVINEN